MNILARLMILLIAATGLVSAGNAQEKPPLAFNRGDLIATGFSGTAVIGTAPPTADNTFIDIRGASVRIFGLNAPKSPWDGSLYAPDRGWSVPAEQIGQVFGVAIGEPPQPNVAPNLYVGATSAYGLHIVRRAANGRVERLKGGGAGAQWAPGQFGLGLQGGPGSIYVVDGASGAVNLLANVTLDGVPNPGPGLGAIAYDAAHKQLFVSDLYTGMIHRIGTDGADLGRLDHGVTVRTQAQLQPVAFDARVRMNITSPSFQVNDPRTWGFAPAPRQVWAVAVHQSRLYYSVQEGPQIWSVGIGTDGAFMDDARLEVVVSDYPGPYPVTDITFASDGAMVLAQRSAFGAGFYEYTGFTQGGEPRVLRYTMKQPNDPPSPGLWRSEAAEYSVGFAGTMRNANGGVAFGYGYDRSNRLNLAACGETLFATGDNLRWNPSLTDRLAPGGAMNVHGIQLSPTPELRDTNFPQPWKSNAIDFDGKDDNAQALGWMGQVRVQAEPCQPAPAQSVAAVSQPPGTLPPSVSTPDSWTDQSECFGPGCQPPNCGLATCDPCTFAYAPEGLCPPPGDPIDLAIRKTGKTSPAPTVNGYLFNLAVTSVSGVYNGAGIITVRDTVPPGMTFASATGTGWNCSVLPASTPLPATARADHQLHLHRAGADHAEPVAGQHRHYGDGDRHAAVSALHQLRPRRRAAWDRADGYRSDQQHLVRDGEEAQ